MTMRRSITHVLSIVGALLGWYALGARFWLTAGEKGWLGAACLLLGYFTILTNIVVALVFTRFSFKPESSKGLNSSSFEFVTVTAILLVGFVYFFLLEGLEPSRGLAWYVDKIYHYLTPSLFTVYWFFRPHGKLNRSHVFMAAIMPLSYCLYAFIRGYLTGWYPYFFIDANKLSVGQIALNAGGLCLAFMLMAVFLLGLDRFLAKRTS